MHGQWSNPVYAVVNGKPQIIFPGGDGWLYAFEPRDRQADLEVRLQPEGRQLRAGRQGHAQRLHRHAGRRTTTSSTSASARTPSTTRASATSGASTSTKTGDVSPELVDRRQGRPAQDQAEPELGPGLALRRPGQHEDQGKIGRNYFFGRTMSTCAVHDGLVYAAELAGYLHCLDAKTGKQLLGARPEGGRLELAVLGRRQGLPRQRRRRRARSSSTARQKKLLRRSTWAAASGRRRSRPTACCT